MRSHQKMRSGIEILADQPGDGPAIERRHIYRVRLRMWLNQGEPIRWQSPWGLLDGSALEDGGHTLITCLRVDRRSMVDGDKGVAGVIPANAVLVAEITFLKERLDEQSGHGAQTG